MSERDVKIIQGLRPEHRDALIQLFCDTFPEVIVPVFGSVKRCALLLEASLVSDRILTAISDDQLIGFAGLHFSGQEWFGPNLRQLLSVLRMRILRVAGMGIFLFKRPKSDALHLDTLAVQVECRGQGIGAQLIGAVEARAQSEGKARVTLDVEDIKPRAKCLYERIGFCETKFEKVPWPWRRAFTFSGTFRMRKDVAPC
jgi:ribosomal protein S18 acetylase RimI-like enzyme